MGENQKHILSLLALFHLTFFVLPSVSQNICENSTDCQALLKFKDGITVDPYGTLQAWNIRNPFCNWTGITCHPKMKNRVIAIHLADKGIEGYITPFISNLSLLSDLSLENNSFHGEIPSSIGELSLLTHVNISDNHLQGKIPSSLQNCRSLEAIDMTYNNLSGVIPDELGLVKSLTYLAISENNLTGSIPPSLSNLTELRRLELAANYFTGEIPPEIGNFKKLDILYLHINFLKGSIPSSLSNATALREISLIENLLSGEIPLELGLKLQNLEKLYLWNNKLSGEIPMTLSNLSRSTLLDLSVNNLTGEVPAELGRLKNLEILYLHSNNLGSGTGNFSLGFLTALTNCSFMKKLHLGSCLFKGPLPSSIGDLSKDLYYFNFIDNHLSGPLPDSIGNLSSLVNLNLGFNSLSGTIPPSFGKLEQLQRLYLGNNMLQGHIPAELGTMANLGLLDLGENLVDGSIPPSLGNLVQLRYLYLYKNRLSGLIPVELTQCSLLLLLDLSFNNLEGSLPSEVSRFSNLAISLNLSSNNLRGEIPESIGKLENLQAMDLSRNNFSGPIPKSIRNCLSLESLNLSNNMLEGNISESLQQLLNLKVLDLAHNMLTGSLPSWIDRAKPIGTLNLSYNRLTGEIPNTGSYKNLDRSSLVGNEGLCGGPIVLGFSPCQAEKEKHKSQTPVHIILAMTLSTFLCILVCIAIFYWCFLKKKPENSPSQDEDLDPDSDVIAFLKPHGGKAYSQRELEIATDGFNEKNLIGKGGFGSVYRATFADAAPVLAVKVLNTDIAQSRKSFKRECRILSSIKHRNLVRLVGSIWTSQFKALILEFVGNGNLEEHLYLDSLEKGQCNLTLCERISILIDVAHGLEYLHEGCPVKYVHCDLKPSNVLLDENMVARVADFGLSKLISGDKPKGDTSTTIFLRGTFGYIPPEHGQGIISPKGDVYSYGIMLLEVMTRKRPTGEAFPNGKDDLREWVSSSALCPNNIWEVLDNSLKQEADSISSNGVPSKYVQCCIDVVDIGIMCTEENPQKRPSMSLVVNRLKDLWKIMEDWHRK